MMFLKSGELYWDGSAFQADYRKGVVFGAMTAAGKYLRQANRIDPKCQIVPLTDRQRQEIQSIRKR